MSQEATPASTVHRFLSFSRKFHESSKPIPPVTAAQKVCTPVALSAETGSLTFGFLCPCVLKETEPSASFSFNTPEARYILRSHTQSQVGDTFPPLQMPSWEVQGLKLLAVGTAHLTQQTRDERVVGKHFSIHFSHPVICHDLRDGTPAFVKAAETSSWKVCVPVALCSGVAANLAELLWHVWREENQRLLCHRSHINSDAE